MNENKLKTLYNRLKDFAKKHFTGTQSANKNNQNFQRYDQNTKDNWGIDSQNNIDTLPMFNVSSPSSKSQKDLNENSFDNLKLSDNFEQNTFKESRLELRDDENIQNPETKESLIGKILKIIDKICKALGIKKDKKDLPHFDSEKLSFKQIKELKENRIDPSTLNKNEIDNLPKSKISFQPDRSSKEIN